MCQSEAKLDFFVYIPSYFYDEYRAGRYSFRPPPGICWPDEESWIRWIGPEGFWCMNKERA